MADYEIRYSLFCNVCVATRYTPYEDYTEPLPTECPVCSSENIKDVAISRVVNKARYEVKEGGTATTQETTPQVATSITLDLEAGVSYKLHWYCEIKMNSNAIAYARVAYQGAQGSGVVGDTFNDNNEFLPFAGCDEFTAAYSESVEIGILFWISNATKVASIRRRRLFVERVDSGE